MEFILYSTGIFAVLVLTFFAIERPYAVATFLVFCFVYKFNIKIPAP